MTKPKVLETVNLTATCPDTEYSLAFLRGMLNRMSVSWHKYGNVSDAYPDKVSALDSLQQRLDKYRETGNTEFLIDAGNFAMIEFMHPALKDAFFKATDSDGSPGRISASGEAIGAAGNEEL